MRTWTMANMNSDLSRPGSSPTGAGSRVGKHAQVARHQQREATTATAKSSGASG